MKKINKKIKNYFNFLLNALRSFSKFYFNKTEIISKRLVVSRIEIAILSFQVFTAENILFLLTYSLGCMKHFFLFLRSAGEILFHLVKVYTKILFELNNINA